MKAVGYTRVSTLEQADHGVSLAAQEAKIKAWAELHDRELVAVHQDAGISGARADTRPALQQALRQACRLRVPLVVHSLSRLARSTLDAITISDRLSKATADLVSLSENVDTTTASGRLFFRLMSSLAEFERDLTAERTRAALQHLRRQGKRTSRFEPFGFTFDDDGKTLVDSPAEQEAITLMKELRAAGWTLRRIAAEVAERGIPTKRGGSWTAKNVRAILLRAEEAA